MKPGLFAKLFLALLGVVAALVVVMAGAVQWSFREGFADYLFQQEQERLAPLQARLALWRGERNDWEQLRENHRLWRGLVEESLPDERPGRLQPPEGPGGGAAPEMGAPPPPPPGGFGNSGPRGWGPPPPPPFGQPPPPDGFGGPPPGAPPGFQGDRHPPEGRNLPGPPGRILHILPRLRLLDGERQRIIGRPEAPAGEVLLPIEGEGQTLGWLALAPAPIETDRLAASFQAQQGRTYGLIALLALALATLAALVLARQLLAPVRRLAAGAKALTAGRYDTRIDARGGDELGRLANDFNTLALTLERNEEARRQWVADISHELRTPLAILRGELEALEDGVREMSPERLRSLHSEVLALGKLVDDLYDLALSDLGALAYRKEPVELVAAIEEVAMAFQPRYTAAGLELLNRSIDLAPVDVEADPRRLSQLFANLLENGLRYTDRGGRLEIRLEKREGAVRIGFHDTPPGAPEEALPHLFERLYRVDKSRSRALGGAGLGLAICKNIVEAHGGTIQAGHSPLGGLAVEIILPRRD